MLVFNNVQHILAGLALAMFFIALAKNPELVSMRMLSM